MKWAICAILGLASCCASGCLTTEGIVGSGKNVTREMNVADFTSVEVDGAFHVEVEHGAAFHTEITADDNLFDAIQIRREGSTLKISGKNFSTRSELKVSITMPELVAIQLGGACTGQFGSFPSVAEQTVGCSGASKLHGTIGAKLLKVDASGASRITLKGMASEVRASASGASDVDLASVAANRATAELSGASKAIVAPKDGLDYSLSGASTLSYSGDPQIGKSENSGASSVVHR